MKLTERETMLFNEAIKHIKIFCKVNDLVTPKVILSTDAPSKCTEGVYRSFSTEIKVFPKNCKPTKIIKKGILNNPYWVEDDSIFGAVVHEFAHYIHYIKFNRCQTPAFAKNSVSNYGNTSFTEDFAETMRVFIANPDLLKTIDSQRYNYLTKTLGLKPIKNVTWNKLFQMKKVPEAYYAAAVKEICC